MRIKFNGAEVDLEELSDQMLLMILYSLREKQDEIGRQIASVSAERFNRRQCQLPLGGGQHPSQV